MFRPIIVPTPIVEPTIIGVTGEIRIHIQEKEEQGIIKNEFYITKNFFGACRTRQAPLLSMSLYKIK